MKKKIIVWSIVAVFAVLTVSAGVWFLLSGDNDPDVKTPPVQAPVAMTQEQAQQQIAENTEIILSAPENVDAALDLADAYCALNQMDKVKEALDRAASLVPTDTRIYDKMVSIYMSNNMVKEALLFIDNISNPEVKRQYEAKLVSQNFPGYTGSGNTSGNIINEGRFVGEGEKIYYSEPMDGDALYSADLDGKNKVKLTDGKIRYLNIVGDYIYFVDLNQQYNICKIKKDGTERGTVMGIMATEVIVLGEQMFFVNWSDGCKIYIANLDGSEAKAINNKMSSNLSLSGAWMYYINQDDETTLYRIRIDGTNEARINDVNTLFVNADREWIYYVNWSDNGKIYRSSNDGFGFEQLNNQRSGYVNVTGEYIYYINWVDNGKLYRMNLDGSDQKKLSDDRGEAVHVFGNWVYYFNQDDAKRMYRCKVSGGGRELVGF